MDSVGSSKCNGPSLFSCSIVSVFILFRPLCPKYGAAELNSKMTARSVPAIISKQHLVNSGNEIDILYNKGAELWRQGPGQGQDNAYQNTR